MRVMVTGGQGFIGSYVIAELENIGADPFVFDRVDRGSGADLFLGDIRDADAVCEAMAHSQGWIHLAGVLGTQETITNPRPAVGTNVLGGLNVLEAAAQYEIPGVNIAVGNHWMENTYSISKNTVERFVRMYRAERDLRVSNVRAFNAYGPGQSIAAPYGDSKVRKIIPAFVCRALTGTPIEIYGDGSQIMDMVHVSDVARVLVAALFDSLGGNPGDFEAGSGERTTVNQIAEMVAHITSVQTGSQPVPVTHTEMRPGEPERSVVLASEPYELLSGYTSLELGLAETISWFYDDWLPSWRG